MRVIKQHSLFIGVGAKVILGGVTPPAGVTLVGGASGVNLPLPSASGGGFQALGAPHPIPEPSTLGLLMAGIASLITFGCRRRSR